MTGAARTQVEWMAASVAMLAWAVVGLAGCGSDHSASVNLVPTPQTVEPAIIGVVSEPHGVFAALDKRWWPDFSLVSRAFALRNQNTNVEPISCEPPPCPLVTLSKVDQTDAGDGRIDAPLFVAQAFTNDGGFYQIIDPAAENVDTCRLMVSVGGGDQTTRAFVLDHTTDINVTTETTVRIVLDRLKLAPSVQLCDFSTEALKNICNEVSIAVVPATGDTIAAMNQNAFDLAVSNGCVRKAVADATGGPADDGRGPIVCLHQ
jgi:hypothetical protein